MATESIPTPDAVQAPADDDVALDQVDELAADAQARLWVRALTPLLQLRSIESDPSARVQFALDKMHIAACERITRILGSDVVA